MILELRNKTPFITFGFNRITKTASTGEVIDVWLNTLYNEVSYSDRTITAPTATVTKVNNYHYQLTYSTTGSKTIDLEVESKRNNIKLNSNTINITIV